MDKAKVSVIVPIYNGEKYLEECLDSILNQTVKDIEIICVDDGSTDRSNEILEKYSSNDARIRIYHQENQFAGIARNTGMKYAEGKYILFLDGDDFFDSSMVEKLYNKSEQDKADICVCDGYRYDDENKVALKSKAYLVHNLLPDKIPFSIEDAEETLFNFTTMNLYNKLYRRDFLERTGIKFKPHRLGEDAGFVLHTLSSAGRITVLDERLFYYRINTNISVTDSAAQDILAGYRTMLEAKNELIEKGIYTEKLKRSFANKALGNCFHFFRKANTLEAYQQLFEKLVNQDGFADLDVADNGEDYYYFKKAYARFHLMMQKKDSFEYLFSQHMDMKQQNQKLTSKLEKSRKKIEKQQGKIENEKEKMQKLKKSATFKIGKMILWLPRKVFKKNWD